jgi:PmbA protein
MSADDLETIARRAVEAALGAGAGDAEAWVERSTERQLRVYDGKVESLSDATSAGVGIRAFIGGRVGYAAGTDLSDAGIKALGEAAYGSASVADEDEHAGLPETTGSAEIDPGALASAELANWSTADKIEHALAIERAARAHDGVSQVEDTVYSDGDGSVALANSKGFTGSYDATSAWAYCSAFAGEGADLMTGMGVGIGRDPRAFDPQEVGDEAARRALALVGARQGPSKRCPVVFDAFVAASFIGFIGGMLSADAVQRGRSLFADKLGEEVATDLLLIEDDGTDPDGFASAPFDGEGSPRRHTPLIAGGRLENFLYDARTARRGDATTTANAERGSYRTPPSVGTSNLVITPGDATLDDLIAQAGDGLYVTDVAGLHSGVNPVSGTFSVGATGRLIENGELGRPVREITIASDLVTMLKGITAVGSESRWVPFGGSVRAVPLLLGEMSMSGS